MQPIKKRFIGNKIFEERTHYANLPASEDIVEKKEKQVCDLMFHADVNDVVIDGEQQQNKLYHKPLF